jgi:uncharacterized protein YoxC
MHRKDLPLLNEALDELYKALNILSEIEGTVKMTKDIAAGTNMLEQEIFYLEEGDA